jgi:F-type H+-transporting ATPase subunit b
MQSLNPIDQINGMVIVFTILVAVATMLAFRKVFVLPFVAVMEDRERDLEAAEEILSEAERLTEGVGPLAEGILTEARSESEAIMQKAREDAESYRKERLNQANERAAKVLEDGRRQIAAERDTEMQAIRERAVECVTTACEKLLGAPDKQTAETAVDRLLAKRMA